MGAITIFVLAAILQNLNIRQRLRNDTPAYPINMNDFTITTQLNIKEYARAFFIGLYKRPMIIIMTIFGLYLVTTAVLDYSALIIWYPEPPFSQLLYGIFMLIFPSLIVLIAVKQLKSNPGFLSDITYTFGESGVAVQGLTFKSEFLWQHIIKQKELDKFLILYHTKKFGNFIDKTKLTTEQLSFIKAKVSRVKITDKNTAQ